MSLSRTPIRTKLVNAFRTPHRVVVLRGALPDGPASSWRKCNPNICPSVDTFSSARHSDLYLITSRQCPPTGNLSAGIHEPAQKPPVAGHKKAAGQARIARPGEHAQADRPAASVSPAGVITGPSAALRQLICHGRPWGVRVGYRADGISPIVSLDPSGTAAAEASCPVPQQPVIGTAISGQRSPQAGPSA